MITQFGTTFRLSLVEQKHNRFAIALLLCYLPGWYGIIAALSAGTIAFKLRAFGIIVITTQERLGLLTGMLNATTLIMGFVGLTVMRQSEAVDQRLVLCGHSRTALVLGRLLALGLVSLAVAAYATGVFALFFPLRHFALVAVGSFVAIAAYVAIGMLVGVVLPGDLEGLFFIIMLSIVDTFMQNPVGSAAANHQHAAAPSSAGMMLPKRVKTAAICAGMTQNTATGSAFTTPTRACSATGPASS